MSPIYPTYPMPLTPESRQILVIGEHGDWLNELSALLKHSPYQLCRCSSVEQIIEASLLNPALPKTIILDQQHLDYDKVKSLKAATHNHPGESNLILALQEDDISVIHRALELGIFFFITPKFSSQMAINIIECAINTKLALSSQLTTLDPKSQLPALVDEAHFTIRTPMEAKTIANILGYLAPAANRVTVGLFELLLNAIEHGNLGIGFAKKAQLLANNELQAYIEHQLLQPEYANKKVSIQFAREADQLIYSIEDEGQGFNPQGYLEFDEERALEKNGRGILIAKRHSFDTLKYENQGRRVIATVQL